MRILFSVSLLVAIAGSCLAQDEQGGPQLVLTGPMIAQKAEREGPQINPADFQGDLDANRAKWTATGITSYVLNERLSCFCPREFSGPFDITVIDGAISTASFSADSGLMGEPQSTRGLLTINEAFERVQGFLNRNTPVARLSVSYDATQGYITSFSVDIDVRIADEEQGYSFELLRVISRRPPTQSLLPYPAIWPTPRQDVFPVSGPISLPARPAAGRGRNTAALELNINRLKWRSVQPNIYTYRLVRGCFCPASFRGPFIVTVTKGKISNVVLEGRGVVAQSDIPTIDGLFDFIAESLSRPNRGGTVEVNYDLVNGIPKKIVIDRAQIPVDGGVTYTAELLREGPEHSKVG